MDASFAVNTRNFYAPCASPEECFASWKCIESPLADSSGPRMWRKTSAKAVKQTLAAKVGISRFKDSYWRIVTACSCEIPDDILAEQLRGSSWSWNSGRLMLKKARRWFRHLGTIWNNDLRALEELLKCPRTPNEAPLHHVAQMGHVAPAEFLVDAEAQINPLDCFGYTPLLVAAGEGNLDIVHLLAENGAAKDQANNYGATPLFVAAAAGHLEIIRFLVEVGAAKDQAKNDGAPPLFVAAVEGLLDPSRHCPLPGRSWCSQKRCNTLDGCSSRRQFGHNPPADGVRCRLQAFLCPPKMWCCESGIATNGNLGSVVRLMADIGALPPPKVRRTGDWGSLAQVLSFLQRKTSTPGVQSRG